MCVCVCVCVCGDVVDLSLAVSSAVPRDYVGVRCVMCWDTSALSTPLVRLGVGGGAQFVGSDGD